MSKPAKDRPSQPVPGRSRAERRVEHELLYLTMTLVDKTLFTNFTNAGLAKEVTQQGDGSEWTSNEDGERVRFNSYGDAVSSHEVE